MALVKLTDAIRDGTICIGDFVDPTECFPKYDGLVILEKERTGLDEDQIFERDKEEMKWIVAKDYLGDLVIYSTTTTFALQIKGKVGKENLDDLLSEISSAFLNDELGIYSDLLSEKDVECWHDDEFFKKKTNSWIEDGSFVILGSNSTHLKGKLIERKDIVSIYKLRDSDGERAGNGVTIVIPLYEGFISSEVLVDTESKAKDGVWKLVVKQK